MANGSPRRLPDEIRQQFGIDRGESAGLFAGVRKIEEPSLHEVPFAVDDAVDLAFTFGPLLDLVEPSRIVLALSGEPQKESSRAALRRLLAAGAQVVDATASSLYRQTWELGQHTGAKGIFLFSFSGHGLTDQGQHLLVTSEFVRRRAVTTALNFTALMADIGSAVARRRLVFLDTCRDYFTAARSEGGDESAMSAEFHRAISAARGAAIFAGTTPGGSTYDDPKRKNGAFTAALVDALLESRPAAGPFLTLGDLAMAVDQKMRRWIAVNRPAHVDKSKGVSTVFDPEAMRNFVVAAGAEPHRRPVEPADAAPRKRGRPGLLAAIGASGVAAAVAIGLWIQLNDGSPARPPQEPADLPADAPVRPPEPKPDEPADPVALPPSGRPAATTVEPPPPEPAPGPRRVELREGASESLDSILLTLTIYDFNGIDVWEVDLVPPAGHERVKLSFERISERSKTVATDGGSYRASLISKDPSSRRAIVQLEKLSRP